MDDQFARAAQGFARGITNLVPLAQGVYGAALGRETWVGCIDGITRTIWFLAHGCPAFPLLCLMSGARDLWRDTGVERRSLVTLRELYQGTLP
jgi:hypothetical protein